MDQVSDALFIISHVVAPKLSCKGISPCHLQYLIGFFEGHFLPRSPTPSPTRLVSGATIRHGPRVVMDSCLQIDVGSGK